MPATQETFSLRDELLDIRRYTLSAISTLEKAQGVTPVSGSLKAQMRRLHEIAQELEE